MPHLASLMFKNFSFFRIGLRPDSTAKRPGVTKIFALGGTILLPDSLFLNRPEHVARLLKWFRGCQLKIKAPQTWKLLTRPRLREWLLSVLQEREIARREAAEETRDAFLDIWPEINEVLPLEDMDPKQDFETPREGMTFVSASFLPGYELTAGFGDKKDNDTIAQNDDILVEWYANWSRDNFENHRKFVILYEGPRDIREVQKSWALPNRHVSSEILNGPSVTDDFLDCGYRRSKVS